jgi:hypothetical protein
MIKPSNYENTSTGDFTPVTPGGHHMIIKQVKEQQTRTGKPMLVVAVDFAPNDSQPLYFSKLFEEDNRPEKKWPHAGTIYVVSTDGKGQCTKNFKTFITSFEHSNGVQTTWGDGPQFTGQFTGKKIGGVFGRVEEEYNGERKIRCLLRWFCEDSKADGAKVPADKLLDQGAAPVPAGFTQVEINTEEIPF